MKRLSPSLVALRIRDQEGTSAASELVPPRPDHAARSFHARAQTLPSGVAVKGLNPEQVVRVEIVDVGRRVVPSARERARMMDRKRGVNDPGVAGPVRPRPLSVGVVHAPRCRCPMRRADSVRRPAILREGEGRLCVSTQVIRPDTMTAITSGSMRALRVAVQGSLMRSDRACRYCVLHGCRCQ